MVGESGPLQFRLERHVDAPRALVWRALVAMLDRAAPGGRPPPSEVGGEVQFALDEWHLRERTIVSEAPGFRSYHVVEGAPTAHYEGTSELIDVNDGCLLAWSVHAQPAPGRDDEFRAFIARAEIAVTRGIEAVLAAVPTFDRDPTHRFVFERELAVAPERVWDAIARLYEAADYATFAPDEPPFGRGAVIRYRYGPWAQHALVATWHPPHRRVYEMLDGAPVRRYRGTISVEPAHGGARLRWECEFVLDEAVASDEYLRLAEETVGRAVEHVVHGSSSIAG
jgi:uncharacterized protein YndB with AHSA1/START domain